MLAPGIQNKVVVAACIAIAIATLTAGIVVWQTYEKSPVQPPLPLPLFPAPSPSRLGVYENAAVSCDAPICSEIGKDILQKGGNVVDAAIAALFCMGVIQTQSMGVGGGFLMVLYNATTKKSITLNAREKAPENAFEDMFDGDPSVAQKGGLAVAVPGELKGYWEMYTKYGGQVPWKDLVEPTIRLCEDGFLVSRHAANALRNQADRIKNTSSMAEIFVNSHTGEVFEQNDTMYRPVLAETLKQIANHLTGANLLYEDSELMRFFVDDLIELGGNITYWDMAKYRADWSAPIKTSLSGGLTLHTVPPPGSGILMSFILKIMDNYNLTSNILQDFTQSSLTYHRFVEALKHAYASRTYLGDLFGDPKQVAQVEELVRNLTSAQYIDSIMSLIKDDTTNTYEYYGAEFYMPEDHGTSHVSIIGDNGDAIAVTSTINLHFGASIRSRRTGIIYNDEMDDFSAPNITNAFGVPPSPNNFIIPGKRPVSSMAPSIITDTEGRARLVIGGAGGTQITTSVAYASMRNLWLGQTIKQAIDVPRLHHQLYPMNLHHEVGFPLGYVETFKNRKHNTTEMNSGNSVVVGISRDENGTIYANSDYRKEGSIDGY